MIWSEGTDSRAVSTTAWTLTQHSDKLHAAMPTRGSRGNEHGTRHGWKEAERRRREERGKRSRERGRRWVMGVTKSGKELPFGLSELSFPLIFRTAWWSGEADGDVVCGGLAAGFFSSAVISCTNRDRTIRINRRQEMDEEEGKWGR